jgi:hypothetical protein
MLPILLAVASMAHAGTPTITAAVVNPANSTLTITGTSLMGADGLGVLSVNFSGTGLLVQTQSTTSITASGVPSISPGVYPLTVRFFGSTAPTSVTFQVNFSTPTKLLFSTVLNTNGFDTAISISNITADPTSGATGIAGSCTLYFLGFNAPTQPFNTPSIAGGTSYANLASTLAPGFDGYVIAACTFKASAVAIGSDVGARNLAWAIPAVVNP